MSNRRKALISTNKYRGKSKLAEFKAAQKEINISNTPLFSFKNMCRRNFLLSEWNSREIERLMDTFQMMEGMEWCQIRTHSGLRMRKVRRETLSRAIPDSIQEDVALYELRVTEKARVFGFIMNNVFHLVWFDRNHEVCSMS